MSILNVARALERAQAHAYPGRESVERDHVLRELWRLLLQQPIAREPMHLRVIRS